MCFKGRVFKNFLKKHKSLSIDSSYRKSDCSKMASRKIPWSKLFIQLLCELGYLRLLACLLAPEGEVRWEGVCTLLFADVARECE